MARALVIVDFQNDFTPGGALAVREGDEIAGRIDELARSGQFGLVVATRDWHPADHRSFAEQGGPWPPHCVQGTPGAELHPYLRERVAGKLHVDVENSSPDEIRAAAAAIVDQHVSATEREALDRMHQGIGRGDRGVSGVAPTMEALEQARVEILLLAEDFDAPELDEALEKAITQSAQVLVVRHHEDLVMHGGIGAVLRF